MLASAATRTAFALFPLAAALAAPDALAAQRPTPPKPDIPLPSHPARLQAHLPTGTRVRVFGMLAPGDLGLVGRVDAVRSDSLLIEVAPGALAGAPLADVTRLEVEREGLHAGRNATLGALTGVVLGAIGAVRYCVRRPEVCEEERRRIQEEQEDPDSNDAVITSTSLFVIGGGVLGGLLGQALTPKRWEVVAVPGRLGAGRRRGWQVGVRVAAAW